MLWLTGLPCLDDFILWDRIRRKVRKTRKGAEDILPLFTGIKTEGMDILLDKVYDTATSSGRAMEIAVVFAIAPLSDHNGIDLVTSTSKELHLQVTPMRSGPRVDFVTESGGYFLDGDLLFQIIEYIHIFTVFTYGCLHLHTTAL